MFKTVYITHMSQAIVTGYTENVAQDVAGQLLGVIIPLSSTFFPHYCINLLKELAVVYIHVTNMECNFSYE